MYSLPELPYAYEALEPTVSANTLHFHHDKHHAAYVTALNGLLNGDDQGSLEAVIKAAAPGKIFNNAAQAWNHAFFWHAMSPTKTAPGADLAAAIAEAKRVSNPGCYPTGFLALVRPLVRAGLVPVDWAISVNAVSGYSGGGKAMIAEYETATDRAFRPYGLSLAHKHAPEMQRHSGLAHAPIFAPAVVDTYRGMVVEVPLPLYALPGAPSLDRMTDVLAQAYADSRIVRFSADAVAAVNIEENAGTDRMTLRVCGNAATGQARLIATLDNLGKGAAGAAVQNLNLALGLGERTGL